MFGEDHLSESSRVPSPWDPFLPSPTSETGSLESHKQPWNGLPKLAPEVEEGNIEYKLKLTDISPARFARLVTQLKWRLLEGSGQAYYELGVADSGALIGLSRADLEQSLETLELMAGEIGASVIVVKEIEVPPAVVALADKVSAYIDPETGKWTEKMTSKRHRVAHVAENDAYPRISMVENETEIEDTDSDETYSAIATPEFLPEHGGGVTAHIPYAHRLSTSNPSRPLAQSSPSIYPIDDDLALFSMEPEPPLEEDHTDAEELALDGLGDIPDLRLDIEITAVYKPRPTRRRVHLTTDTLTNIARPPRRAHKNKDKKRQQPWHSLSPTGNASLELLVPVPAAQEDRALQKRIARDKRREEKRTAVSRLADSGLATSAELSEEVSFASADREVMASAPTDAVSSIAQDLQSLHVNLQSTDAVVIDPGPQRPLTAASPEPDFVTYVATAWAAKVSGDAREPRLIVEALVVRKMSLEEEFLDFGGLE